MPKAQEEVIEIHPCAEHTDFVQMMTMYLRDTLRIYNDFLRDRGKRGVPRKSSTLQLYSTI